MLAPLRFRDLISINRFVDSSQTGAVWQR